MTTLSEYLTVDAWADYHRLHLTGIGGELPEAEPAYWFGQASEYIGLTGPARRVDALRLLSGRHPSTGNPLRQRMGGIAHYELTYSTPKSYSILALFDPRLPAMMVPAANAGLREVERNANARVRKGSDHDSNAVRATRNLAAICVPNTTNRLGEPQRHTHSALGNLTLDPYEVQWKAIDLGWLFNYWNRKLDDLVCHNELARQLRAAGYEVVRTRHAFEIAGVPDAFLKAVSQRRDAVLDKAEALVEERDDLELMFDPSESDKRRLKHLRALDEHGLRDLAARESRGCKSEPSDEEVRNRVCNLLGVEGVKMLQELVAAAQRAAPMSAEVGVDELAVQAQQHLNQVGAITFAMLKVQLLHRNLGSTSLQDVETVLDRPECHVIDRERQVVCSADGWSRLKSVVAALSASRGSILQLRCRKGFKIGAGKHAALVGKLADIASPWVFVNLVRHSDVISARRAIESASRDTGLSLSDEPAEQIQGTIMVGSSLAHLCFGIAPPVNCLIIVFRGRENGDEEPVEDALAAMLVDNGAVAEIRGAEVTPSVVVIQTSSDAFDAILGETFLGRLRHGWHFPQVLAADEAEAREITTKLRRRIHGAESPREPLVGDLLRATGDNRLGSKRTYRGRQYLVRRVLADGALETKDGLVFPVGWPHWDFGFTVHRVDDVSPSTGAVFVSPTVAPRDVMRLHQLRPKAGIVAYTFLATDRFWIASDPDRARPPQVKALNLINWEAPHEVSIEEMPDQPTGIVQTIAAEEVFKPQQSTPTESHDEPTF
jgi:conjugative relaxase-like TrwC/TraI family protein